MGKERGMCGPETKAKTMLTFHRFLPKIENSKSKNINMLCKNMEVIIRKISQEN